MTTCDICNSGVDVGTYCRALDTIDICAVCYESINGIHIAAIINSQKNRYIAALGKEIEIYRVNHIALLGENKALKDALLAAASPKD